MKSVVAFAMNSVLIYRHDRSRVEFISAGKSRFQSTGLNGSKMRSFNCAAILSVVSVVYVSTAAWAGDDLVSKGRSFADLVCSPCHVVSLDKSRVPLLRNPGPSFPTVAGRPSTTEASLREYLMTAHPEMGPARRMTNPRLADYEIDEVVAYILSLGKVH
ncbi:c-type cytochrome [Bradyrhizobium sp. STM 3809]|uniref:c-type cytochrome n=1 Tax=Bradyrhizobium sp. STM 3809 TaxID=551936 RepID=UPI0011125EC6|nr:c-type cytochrome [Bradyrhizobium sp. STM 3809]